MSLGLTSIQPGTGSWHGLMKCHGYGQIDDQVFILQHTPGCFNILKICHTILTNLDPTYTHMPTWDKNTQHIRYTSTTIYIYKYIKYNNQTIFEKIQRFFFIENVQLDNKMFVNVYIIGICTTGTRYSCHLWQSRALGTYISSVFPKQSRDSTLTHTRCYTRTHTEKKKYTWTLKRK